LYQGCTVTKTSHLPIRYFLALLWAHPILHVSRIRVKEKKTLLNSPWCWCSPFQCLNQVTIFKNRRTTIRRTPQSPTVQFSTINRLTPNDAYMGRTAPLTSKRYILYIYSTNVGTEYFKHALYSPFFLFKVQFVS